MKKSIIAIVTLALTVTACGDKLAEVREDALKATVITEPTPNDTDDPAIWINPADASKSLIVGTDKDSDGGLYVYDLEGKIVTKSIPLKRPNNVDIAYGLDVAGKKTDIAVTTERETKKIRIFSLPDMKAIDNGGIEVFKGEAEGDPMGIALYTRPSDSAVFAIVGRKNGPADDYLWQYQLQGTTDGNVSASLVRKFGKFSGTKEIEAIAVDNELGYVYYSDEQSGVRKYMADPKTGNNKELAFFGNRDFVDDNEGIAIYKTSTGKGYLLVSNQQANTFMVYAREGSGNDPNDHKLIAEVPVSTVECDGADATNVNLGGKFPQGMLVAMSNGMTFHYYEWNEIQKIINEADK